MTSTMALSSPCHFPFIITLLLLLLLLSCNLPTTNAILPTAAIDVDVITDGSSSSSHSYTLFASQGNFAPYPPMTPERNKPMSPLLPDSFLNSIIKGGFILFYGSGWGGW